ncbi:MAG TPA: HD domain-containing phosphohydrolase [Geobacteraceae bacterium]
MLEQNDERAKVLFVDDEEYILKSLKRLLGDEDIDVLTATSGEEGLELLRQVQDIGLIVSDQRMPGLLGADFLQQAREIAPDALRIMLTGYADITATIEAINKGGAYRYISKPWNDEEMLLTIRDGLRQSGLIAENKRLSALVRKQNVELKEWNDNLKSRVLEQTTAIRIRNNELGELNYKLQRNYEGCLKAFSGLVELRDRETENHSRNVARLSGIAAENLNLPAAELEIIKVAALLHDIGKIGIADSLLHGDTERMTPEGFAEYRLHAVRGQTALDSIEDLRPAGLLIRHHHENFDGSGFPDRLSREEIPLGARLIGMADFLDRSFVRNRADNAVEMALKTTRAELGRKLDPALYPHMEQPFRDIYTRFTGKSGMVEMELHPKDLREGMIVAREVRSGTGLLLLGSGEALETGKIMALRRYFLIDPPQKERLVHVYVGR